MAGTTIVVGDTYEVHRPGSPRLRCRIVTALQATPVPHLWVEMLSDEFTNDPALLVVGPGLILAPVPPATP